MPVEAQAWANARSTSAGVSLLLLPFLPFEESEEEAEAEEEASRSPAARTSFEKRAPSISAVEAEGVASGNAGIADPEAATLKEEPEGRRAP